jgi:ankyrin repeat protein
MTVEYAVGRARCALIAVACSALASHAQVPPSPAEKAGYSGLHAAAARGDAAGIKALIAKGEKPDTGDGYARTPLHVAAYGGHHEAMRALVAAGANPNRVHRAR